MTRTRLVVPALVLTCLLPNVVAAQRKSAALVGWIRDSTGAPVLGADVQVQNKEAFSRTDSSGLFRFGTLEPGMVTFRVRRLGYSPQTFEVTLHEGAVDSIVVKMSPSAALLDAMHSNAAVTLQYRAIEDFYKRRAKGGGGYFFTRNDIESRHTSVLSEVLRIAPGVRITRPGRRTNGGLRFLWATTKSYDCPPQLWVDGRRVRSAEVDDYPAGDVEAVELYAGPATGPVQFSLNDMSTCGTILIWTRIPGEP